MMVTGGCQCGAVRYEATGAPNHTGICECRMCQRATGALVYSGAQFDGDKVRWTSGRPKLFRSSSLANRGFCGHCGTTLTYENIEAGTISIMIATLDDPEAMQPTDHEGIEGRASWFGALIAAPGAPTEAMPADFEDYQFKAPGGR